MQVTAQQVLHFLVARRKGAEDAPVKFGNVQFWHPVPGFPVNLCYDIPTNLWNAEAVQNDLNEDAKTCWPELVKHLESV